MSDSQPVATAASDAVPLPISPADAGADHTQSGVAPVTAALADAHITPNHTSNHDADHADHSPTPAAAAAPAPVVDHAKAAADKHRKEMGHWLTQSVGKRTLLVLIFIRGSWDQWCKNYIASLVPVLPLAERLNVGVGVITCESHNNAAFLQHWLRTTYNVTDEQIPIWSDPGTLFAKKYGINVVPITRVTVKPDEKSADAATAEATTEVKLDQVKWQLGPLVESQIAKIIASSPDEYAHGITPAALAFIAEKHDHLLQRWQSEPTFNNLHGATDRPNLAHAIQHVYDKYKNAETIGEWTLDGPEVFAATDPKQYSAVVHLYEQACPEYSAELANRAKAREREEAERKEHERAVAEEKARVEAAHAEAERKAVEEAEEKKRAEAEAEARLTL